MSYLFERCREAVTAKEAALRYGIQIDRQGKAVCPFHNDHHPSMTFRDGKYRCWACGAAGDSVDFTARLLGLDALGAVRRLNEDFSLALPLDRPPTDEERAQARQRGHLAEISHRYEIWREQMLRDLSASFRLGYQAKLEKTPEEWNAEELLAIQWLEALESWEDALESDMSQQMEVFRDREGVERLCKRILNSSKTKSTVA